MAWFMVLINCSDCTECWFQPMISKSLGIVFIDTSITFQSYHIDLKRFVPGVLHSVTKFSARMSLQCIPAFVTLNFVFYEDIMEPVDLDKILAGLLIHELMYTNTRTKEMFFMVLKQQGLSILSVQFIKTKTM